VALIVGDLRELLREVAAIMQEETTLIENN
jgi:hypothetical protein